MKKRVYHFLLLISFITYITACGGGGGSSTTNSSNTNSSTNQNSIIQTQNTNFNTSTGWTFIDYRGYAPGDEVEPDFYDAKISHLNDGSGSAYLSHSGTQENRNDRLVSEFAIPVTPGKIYTLSFWMMTKEWPSSTIQAFGAFLDKDGNELYNSSGSRTSNSQKGIWEEAFVKIEVPNDENIKYFQIRLAMHLNDISTKIWVDDFALTEGIFLPQKPQKNSFSGTITQIDSLGNFIVDGQPFFPLGIFGDVNKDWSIYTRQGFNTYMWATTADDISRANAAGLKSALQVVQYITETNLGSRYETLSSDLDTILNSPDAYSLLFYYIDNEFYTLDPYFIETVETIRQKDNNARPIYMLNGDYALARKYDQYSDITGAYVAKDGTSIPTVNELLYEDREPNQSQPSVFAQINAGVGNNFKAVLFGAIAHGAKAAAYWRDGGSAGAIENQPWWSDLPTIRNQIDKMLNAGIIQADHNPAFKAIASNSDLITGTRMVNGTGYIIVANPTDHDIATTFSVENLGYKPTGVVNFFTNETVKIIPAHEGLVIKLTQ